MTSMSMYPTDKMKMGAPGYGRYSPTYRGPDQMRRCMTNPSVSFFFILIDEKILKKSKEILLHLFLVYYNWHNANPIDDANTHAETS